MSICAILNIIMIIAFCWELWMDYAALDGKVTAKVKAKYIARIIVASVVMAIALDFLYERFGVTTENLGRYLRYGRID